MKSQRTKYGVRFSFGLVRGGLSKVEVTQVPVPLDAINGHYNNELGLKGDVYIAADGAAVYFL